MQKSLIPDILKKIAPSFGASILMCDNSELIGQVRFANGYKKHFLYGSIDVNTAASVEIAGDKHRTGFFLLKAGFPVPVSDFLNSIGDHDDFMRKVEVFVKKSGYPFILKPNAAAQGIGVLKINSEEELVNIFNEIHQGKHSFLFQEFVGGRDYRVVVLENQILSVYERIPLFVDGDGIHSIQELLALKQEEFRNTNRNTILNQKDSRIERKLKQQGMGLASVPTKGSRVFLLDNANLSTGGESKVIDAIHDDFKKIAVSVTKELGLRFAGIDFIIQGDILNSAERYWVLEVNASPDLENNFPIDEKHLQHLERCYREIFKVMDDDVKKYA